MDNYDLIFSKNSAKKITISNDNIATGFDFLGSTPPSRYIFDYLFYRNDNKCKYVNDEITSKLQIKTDVDNMLSSFNSTKNKIDEVSDIKTNIENAKTLHDNEFPSYTTSNNTNVTNIQNINSDISSIMDTITSLKADITNMISDNSYYNSNESSVNTKKEQLDSVIYNLNEKTKELLSKTDTSNVTIPNYISKNMIVRKGDVLKCTKLPNAYSILCITAGTTDSVNDLPDFLANTINDGYEFTYGTATFRLFLNFLSLPINGKVDYLTGNSMIRIDENGYLINPYNNLRTKRRLIRYSDISKSEYGNYNWYIMCHKISSCGINDTYSNQYHKNTDTDTTFYSYGNNIYINGNSYFDSGSFANFCVYPPYHRHVLSTDTGAILSTYDSSTMDSNKSITAFHNHYLNSNDTKTCIGNNGATYNGVKYNPLYIQKLSTSAVNHDDNDDSLIRIASGSTTATEETRTITTDACMPDHHHTFTGVNKYTLDEVIDNSNKYKLMNLRRSNQLLRSINVFVVVFNS